MMCQHCCGANRLFDEKNARRDLKKYLKKGPSKPTGKLIRMLSEQKVSGLTLLDIGGGIGALHLELLAKGALSVTDTDASEAYLEIAGAEAARRGLAGRVRYVYGDFTDQGDIPDHDMVTLDKVICCYPDVEKLLSQSLGKSRCYYGIVYPRDGWMADLLTGTANLWFRIMGNPFRTYIHPVRKVRAIIADTGFERIGLEHAFPWIIELYKNKRLAEAKARQIFFIRHFESCRQLCYFAV